MNPTMQHFRISGDSSACYCFVELLDTAAYCTTCKLQNLILRRSYYPQQLEIFQTIKHCIVYTPDILYWKSTKLKLQAQD